MKTISIRSVASQSKGILKGRKPNSKAQLMPQPSESESIKNILGNLPVNGHIAIIARSHGVQMLQRMLMRQDIRDLFKQAMKDHITIKCVTLGAPVALNPHVVGSTSSDSHDL